MTQEQRFTSVRFRNYKTLKRYSLSLRRFNVLVGPNNSGKSTILGAFRILAEGIRRARAKSSSPIRIEGTTRWGYSIDLSDLPVSTENVFTNYDDSEAARIEFHLSDGKELHLIFPELGSCYLICVTSGPSIRTPRQFRTEFPITIGFVPVLGPVDHEEFLYQKEAARKALLTHGASRNFRNIWYHFPEEFDEFRDFIRSTWPGMDIERPTATPGIGKATLHMFCPEERYPREIYWAGFGFQVWCQMLTYAIRAKDNSLLIIDEPDIYLHSDLQRQLLTLLDELGPDILIATHSTEIISEVEAGDLLVLNKRAQSAKRLSDPSGIQRVFEGLGSNLNPTLTQLAKSRRVVFVEGKDFQIISSVARKCGFQSIAHRTDFAVISVEGFNPEKVKDYSKGIELALGQTILKAVIFDRDYRSDSEIVELERSLCQITDYVHIHRRKEIENYLLEPIVLQRAVKARLDDQNDRTGKSREFSDDILQILTKITDTMKADVQAQYYTRAVEFEKSRAPFLDRSTIAASVIVNFSNIWDNLSDRLGMVPGKKILSMFNQYLQDTYEIALSPGFILGQFGKRDIPEELSDLLSGIDKFRKASP